LLELEGESLGLVGASVAPGSGHPRTGHRNGEKRREDGRLAIVVAYFRLVYEPDVFSRIAANGATI
jgi:hypothetical protein